MAAMPDVDFEGCAWAMATVSTEVLDPEETARSAGLRYVSDQTPGIRRRRAGKGFVYISPQGDRLTDRDEVARIKALAVPPAWTDVWICPSRRGHIQATGRDARGRKQYRYHDRWREVRDQTKYERMVDFGWALPSLRARVKADLARPELPREKVLAAVVRLLDSASIRVGNTVYARENGSYGLTTMRDQHVNVFGSRMRFRFRGKGGKLSTVDLTDRRLASVVKRCQDLPGEELFQYVDDDGRVGSVTSEDVNGYLQGITGQDFTAKDFRTWAGSALCAQALAEGGGFRSEREAQSKIVQAIKIVAEKLGNTPTVCRACYVHPWVLESYTKRGLQKEWKAAQKRSSAAPNGLREEEAALLRILRTEPAAA
jgi:DNA topoisomerase-1